MNETKTAGRACFQMIKPLRKALNLSVNDLSALIDVNERTIRRWEYGEIPTPRAVLLLLDEWKDHGSIPPWAKAALRRESDRP